RHTRFSRDWSSDVCSADLVRHQPGRPRPDGPSRPSRREPARLKGSPHTKSRTSSQTRASWPPVSGKGLRIQRGPAGAMGPTGRAGARNLLARNVARGLQTPGITRAEALVLQALVLQALVLRALPHPQPGQRRGRSALLEPVDAFVD